MIIKINDERGFEQSTLYFGYLEENNSTTIEFEFPEYLEKYNKKLNFMLADGTTVCKLFDDINSNKFTFTRDLLKFNKLQMAIEFFDTNENLIYRTSILTIRISDSIICDDDVFEDDSKVVILNELIQKVTELDSSVTENENLRESNEQTRISNEETRVANETAREEYVTQLKKDRELGNLDGATFTPQINENGDLSWSNNKGLVNPQTINIRGPEGKEGKKGEQGEPFRISKTYPSVEAMQSDFENMQIDSYVMIATSIELEDNAKLYYRAETEWVYITDFSGAVGIQGPKGDDGDTGAKGEQGNPGVGISKLEVIDGALYVTLTNNVKESAGVILTDEVKAWLVSQITDNAESDFNEYYNSKVEEFNTNATEKTTAYNDNASEKLSEYNTNATNKISEYNSNAEAILKLLPNKTTEIAEVIDVDDAAESSFNKSSIFGNSEQDSREGYNVFNYLPYVLDSINGLTIDKDENTGYITINGTPTANISNLFNPFINITDLLEDGEIYTLKQESLQNSNLVYGQIIEENIETQSRNYYATNNTNTKEITVDLSTYIYYANIQAPSAEQTGTLDNFKTRFMIYKGTEDKAFELFGASPSPDYPQEIESMGRKSKNILNISDLYTESTINGVNVKYNNDGSLTLNGTATSDIDLYLRQGVPLEHGNYTYKCFGLPENIYTNIYYVGDVYGEIEKRFTVSNDNNYGIVIKIPINTTINTIIKPMLVKGIYYDTTFPQFEPFYNSKIIKFKRIKKNFLDLSKARGGTSSGITVEIKKDGSYSFVGTATDSAVNVWLKGDFSVYTNYQNWEQFDKNVVLFKLPKGNYIIKDCVVFYVLKNSKKGSSSNVLNLENDAYVVAIRAIHATVGNVYDEIKYPSIIREEQDEDFEAYDGDDYILPIQQNMYALVPGQEDCFIKKDDGKWYERHYSFEGILDEEAYNIGPSGNVIFNLNEFGFPKSVYTRSTKQYLNYFKFYAEWASGGAFLTNNNLWISGFNDKETLSQFIQTKRLEGNPIKIVYIRGERNGSILYPLDLECTPEQVKVLNKLEQFSLSRGINHIYSDDELSPKFQLKYYQDMNILLDKINKNIADVSAEII